MNIIDYNRKAWNATAKKGSRWCYPVGPKVIREAKAGRWKVILTPNKAVPKKWFGALKGKDVLGLASGGGQQVPVLAAAGARVTSFDNSEEQLDRDRSVSDRDGLGVRTIQGDMRDLSAFADGSFDLIIHPVSNLFVEDVNPVWKECFRVLRPGGRLLAGFLNSASFLFNHDEAATTGALEVRYRIPYSDLTSISEAEKRTLIREKIPLEFGHSLQDQIGGQIKAGFVIAGFYEDDWDDDSSVLNHYFPMYIATLARKLPL